MFSLRIDEVPLPGAERDKEQLIEWLAESLNLIRRKNEESKGNLTGPPLFRMLNDYFLSEPKTGFESIFLAESLAISPATLHHHLGRLLDSRLVSSHTHKGAGSRIYFLRTASITGAIDLMIDEAKQILNIRLNQAEKWMSQIDAENRIEYRDETLNRIWIQEIVPPSQKFECSEQTLWMADLGLLGDRPGKSLQLNNLQSELWTYMANESGPKSLDEFEKTFTNYNKSKIQRVLEIFRHAGFFERVPRYDRLGHSIWNMVQTQNLRRGADWLLHKGGLIRQLGEKKANKIIEKLEKNNLKIIDIENCLNTISNDESMLLLNLLGGRLSFGYQWTGKNYSEIAQVIKDRTDRSLRRIRRVAELLQKQI
ncbi:MAG: hypothetical protein CMB56_003490 [Methanobacteriota archaeon]|nr:MAG: hypothetical protein CMB56_003490 [Euryarchaeota archaeon]